MQRRCLAWRIHFGSRGCHERVAELQPKPCFGRTPACREPGASVQRLLHPRGLAGCAAHFVRGWCLAGVGSGCGDAGRGQDKGAGTPPPENPVCTWSRHGTTPLSFGAAQCLHASRAQPGKRAIRCSLRHAALEFAPWQPVTMTGFSRDQVCPRPDRVHGPCASSRKSSRLHRSREQRVLVHDRHLPLVAAVLLLCAQVKAWHRMPDAPSSRLVTWC
jgi:hypothetical protein